MKALYADELNGDDMTNRFGEDEQLGSYRRPTHIAKRVRFCGTRLKQTEKAIQLRIEDMDSTEVTIWLPLSQIEIVREDSDIGEVIGTIPEWLAKDKNLA